MNPNNTKFRAQAPWVHIWGAIKQVFENISWFSMVFPLKMIILGWRLGVPPFKETPICDFPFASLPSFPTNSFEQKAPHSSELASILQTQGFGGWFGDQDFPIKGYHSKLITVCIYIYIYLDLPKGAKWFLKGANLPSLRVSLAPLGRCWYILDYKHKIFFNLYLKDVLIHVTVLTNYCKWYEYQRL